MNLVTGATGFLGTHLLAKLILQQEKTIAIFRNEKKKEHSIKILLKDPAISTASIAEYIQWEEADILDVPRLEEVFENGIKHLYHCAGFISNSPSDYKKMRRMHIHGTKNIVNLSIALGVKKMCHVSSIATLSPDEISNQMTEKITISEQDKTNVYAIAKYGAEREVWRATQEGLDAVIVNPGVILGDGFEASGSGLILKKAKDGFPFYIPKKTGFVDVYDCVEIMYQLTNHQVSTQRFILVSENTSFKKVMTRIAEKYQTKPPRYKLTKTLFYMIWGIESVLSIFGYKKQTNLDLIKNMNSTSAYDNSKIKETLNYQFRSLEVSIDRIATRDAK